MFKAWIAHVIFIHIKIRCVFPMCPSQESDGEKSDDNLVVDVSNEVQYSLAAWRLLRVTWSENTNPSDSVVFACARPLQEPVSPRGSPAHSPRENGLDKRRLLKKDAPLSPSSIASSSSTPSSKSKEINLVSHLGNYSLLIFFFIVSLGAYLFLGIHKNVVIARKV